MPNRTTAAEEHKPTRRLEALLASGSCPCLPWPKSSAASPCSSRSAAPQPGRWRQARLSLATAPAPLREARLPAALPTGPRPRTLGRLFSRRVLPARVCPDVPNGSGPFPTAAGGQRRQPAPPEERAPTHSPVVTDCILTPAFKDKILLLRRFLPSSLTSYRARWCHLPVTLVWLWKPHRSHL